jgi:hypothetical protein
MFVTTSQPQRQAAGCLAIAAVQEVAERFGEEREEAGRFLENRTYVDGDLRC